VSDNPTAIPDVPYSIRVVSPSKSFVLGTDSLAEKLVWMKHLTEAVEAHSTHLAVSIKGGKTAGAAGTKAAGSLDSFGAVAPVWVGCCCFLFLVF
jgi:hypothetical protein